MADESKAGRGKATWTTIRFRKQWSRVWKGTNNGVERSCNTSSITYRKTLWPACYPKDAWYEWGSKIKARKTEEATEGSSTGVSKKVTEEEGRADLKVALQVAPTEVRLLKAVWLSGWHSKIVTSSVPQTCSANGRICVRTNFEQL